MKILITTLFRGDVNPTAMYKIGADRVAFVTDTTRTKQETIDSIKQKFEKLTKIDIIKIPQFDVPKITEELIKYAKRFSNDEIIFHASEGRKTMFLGCLYAASLLRAKCFYLREEGCAHLNRKRIGRIQKCTRRRTRNSNKHKRNKRSSRIIRSCVRKDTYPPHR